MALTYADIRALLIDPQILKLKEELYGSGVSFGRFQDSKLPPSTVVVGGGGGTTDPGTLGYIKGVAVYSGGTLIGSDKKELSFLGAGVTVAGSRATIDIATPLTAKITNPMTAAGDIIYGLTGGTPTRRAIGSTADVLTVVGGVPAWAALPASGLSNPMTTKGDIIYAASGNVATRLPIGTSAQVLTVAGGTPVWSDPIASSGGGGTTPNIAVVYNSTSQSIPAFTYPTFLTFDTAIKNVGGMWSSGAQTRLTCQRSGVYIMVGSAACDGASGSQFDTQLQVQVFNSDDTTDASQDYNVRHFSAFQCSINVTGAFVLTAGQYIKINYYQTTAGTRNTNTGTTSLALIEQV